MCMHELSPILPYHFHRGTTLANEEWSWREPGDDLQGTFIHTTLPSLYNLIAILLLWRLRWTQKRLGRLSSRRNSPRKLI
jgi:hypothetical protein